jgi:hypothetical protein
MVQCRHSAEHFRDLNEGTSMTSLSLASSAVGSFVAGRVDVSADDRAIQRIAFGTHSV